ncbi:MAG: histidine phosphatase family protein [Propionibacteriales bacterium]|nr:histidine phosphatase family protein [Propionibacteriales bacterium]
MSMLLLVRHAQASFGQQDYDVLSPQGERQAAVLGEALRARGVTPALVVTGQLRRQRETAEIALAAAGLPVVLDVDAGFDEYDHEDLLTHAGPLPDGSFQQSFEEAVTRWVRHRADGPYAQSFPQFGTAVSDAVRRTTAALERGQTAVVVTSGGPIAWAVTQLLGGDGETWRRLNTVVVNTGISKIVVGRRGITLVSFNDHSHLDGPHAGLLSYR